MNRHRLDHAEHNKQDRKIKSVTKNSARVAFSGNNPAILAFSVLLHKVPRNVTRLPMKENIYMLDIYF